MCCIRTYIHQVKFAQDDGIANTVLEIEELNERPTATTDSMFVGQLVIHLVGADKLRNMSVIVIDSL